jgi:hypothetical protein
VLVLLVWLYVVSSCVVLWCLKECKCCVCIARESSRTVTTAERNDVVVKE